MKFYKYFFEFDKKSDENTMYTLKNMRYNGVF